MMRDKMLYVENSLSPLEVFSTLEQWMWSFLLADSLESNFHFATFPEPYVAASVPLLCQFCKPRLETLSTI